MCKRHITKSIKWTIAEEIAEKIESNPDIKLLAIRDLTKFLVRDKDPNWNTNDDANTLKKALGTIYRACIKNKVAIIATGDCNISNNGIIPKPIGGTYLKHIANVIVHFKPISGLQQSNNNDVASPYISFKASMIKHPYQRTPKSVNFYARKIGKRMKSNVIHIGLNFSWVELLHHLDSSMRRLLPN